MKPGIRSIIGAIAIGLMTIPTMADQTPQLSKVMREKLTRSQAILGALVTSNWTAIDRESRELAKAAEDPAWTMLKEPEYLRFSDAFLGALTRLGAAAASKDLDAATDAQIELTRSCVQCHRYLMRQRLAR